MSTQINTTVRMFGALHSLRKELGLLSTVRICIPADGCTACDLARDLKLPIEKVDAVFINHTVRSLNHTIQAGDRVAFVPTGITGLISTTPGIDILARFRG